MDVADDGEHKQEDVAIEMGVTKQRAQQIEAKAIAKMRRNAARIQREMGRTNLFADRPAGFDVYDLGEQEPPTEPMTVPRHTSAPT